MEDQEQKDLRRFSWSSLFTVTGICCILFYFLLKMLDGEASPLFIKAGFWGIATGLLVWLLQLPNKSLPDDNFN